MQIRKIVLEILKRCRHEKMPIISPELYKKFLQSDEIKAEVKIHKKPRSEGGDHWDNEKIKRRLDKKYKSTIRGTMDKLKKMGCIIISHPRNDPRRLVSVIMGDSKITAKEVAYRITNKGLMWLKKNEKKEKKRESVIPKTYIYKI